MVSVVAGTPTLTLKLGYDNGTYSTIPTGSYVSLYRINNTWFVNGAPLTDDTDLDYSALVFGLLAVLIGVGGISLFILRGKH